MSLLRKAVSKAGGGRAENAESETKANADDSDTTLEEDGVRKSDTEETDAEEAGAEEDGSFDAVEESAPDTEEDNASNVVEGEISNNEEDNIPGAEEADPAETTDNDVFEISAEEQDMTVDELMALPVEDRLAQMSSDDEIASGTYGDVAWVIDASGKLTVNGTWPNPTNTNMPWVSKRDSIISAEINLSGLKNAGGMFNSYSNLKSLDLSGFDTSEVTWMGGMFSGCTSLTDIDLSGSFNTSKVENMNGMFEKCSSLESLDLSSFDVSKVENMQMMFYCCAALTDIDLSSFGKSNVKDIRYMFAGCSSLKSLDLSSFDVSKVEIMWGMFNGCTALTEIKLGDFDTSNVTGMSRMFAGCENLASLDVSGFNTSKVTSMSGMFSGCKNLAGLDVSGFDTSNVITMQNMFNSCENLANLDVSGFKTSNVTNMSGMFSGCENLAGLDVSGFDTSKVTDMNHMFESCRNLKELDVSHFDTSNVTDMSYMFDGCKNFASLDVSGFKTSKVTNMNDMFSQCENLVSLDVSGFDTSNVTTMQGMFGYCYNLSSLDLSSFDASNARMGHIFMYSNNLKVINTPKNVKESVELPEGTWLMPDGKEINELPMNNSESITITRKDSGSGGTGGGSTDNPGGGTGDSGGTDNPGGGSGDSGETDTPGGGSGGSGETDKPENTEGLKFGFVSSDGSLTDKVTYIYTGNAITPAVSVTNNGETLVEGTDYTVKYSNNIKVTESAQVTISGKGNLSGKNRSLTFTIKAKKLDNSDISTDDKTAPAVEVDTVTVAEGAKASPVITYNGVQLKNNKDFTLSDNDKNHKWSLNESNPTITVTGKGNFEGTTTLKVVVISKAQQKNVKIKADITKGFKGYTYDGTPKYLEKNLSVYTAQTQAGQAEQLKKDTDYVISYPSDITSAGTKKIIITGISERCMGSVTKSYKITPNKAVLTVEYDKDNKGYAYVRTGTKVDDLVVKAGNTVLTEGKDYKVTYSGNKNVGSKAKFTVTGIGNYKGSKAANNKFTINAVVLNNNKNSGSTEGLKIISKDMVFKKAGVYKSAPYVDLDGVTLKRSDYTVSYYLDDPRDNPSPRVMDSHNKVTAGDTTVWVKVVGKGNYKSDDNTCYAVGSYKVCAKPDTGIDLSKAKISFKDSKGTAIKKTEYTGNPIDGDNIKVEVTCKVNGQNKVLEENKDYTVEFVNNVNKGKATVIIKGAEGQTAYVGSKTATFSIVARKL